MGCLMLLVVMFLFPFFLVFVIIYAIYDGRKKAEEEAQKIAAKKAEIERRHRLEVAEKERLAKIEQQKKAEIEHFHTNIFPICTNLIEIQSQWNIWPLCLHNEPAKIERQKRSLYNTLPVLIDSQEMLALFFPNADSNSFSVYKTTLQTCTCLDFQRRGGPCKHIYRLFYELTNLPYGNPGIVDIDHSISDAMINAQESIQFLFFDWLFRNEFTVSPLHPSSPALNYFIENGILLESFDLSPMDYEPLLNAMTKDQIILALAKRHISGFYSSWPKYKLIAWILNEQPQFLKRQFSKYKKVSINPSISEWIDGVFLSKRSNHIYISDQSLLLGYTPYQ